VRAAIRRRRAALRVGETTAEEADVPRIRQPGGDPRSLSGHWTHGARPRSAARPRARNRLLLEAHEGSPRPLSRRPGSGRLGSGTGRLAAFGVARQKRSCSWSQVGGNVAFMAEATSITVLLDGDTGYGTSQHAGGRPAKSSRRGDCRRNHRDKLLRRKNSFLASERKRWPSRRVMRTRSRREGQPDRADSCWSRASRRSSRDGSLAEANQAARRPIIAPARRDPHTQPQSSPAEIVAFPSRVERHARPCDGADEVLGRTPTEEFRARRVSGRNMGQPRAARGQSRQ